MSGSQGHFLVVDDNVINRKLLARALAGQGYSAETAADGQQALARLRSPGAAPVDIVLLDVIMPQMDGYQVLQQIKADPALRDIPVIMISALDELDSVVRCIELGAEDYLSKPYNQALLRARISACLEKKRLRDQEVAYLRNVALLTSAAAAVESASFAPAELGPVAARDDALGQLARVFQRMAQAVHAREQRLRLQLQQLELDAEERRRAADETLATYLPMDRRQALARGQSLPEAARGAGLFADISGFTPLTEALAQELGPQRGAEELTRQINRVYGALVEEVHRFGGSVISFSGDAITCWFEDGGPPTAEGHRPPGAARAAACGLAMQAAMAGLSVLATPAGRPIQLAVKVAVTCGPARRMLVGDPAVQLVEVLAGQTMLRLAAVEHMARGGEVLLDAAALGEAGAGLAVAGWREDAAGLRAALLEGAAGLPAAPWPPLPPQAPGPELARPWLNPQVAERVGAGKSEFLSELRPAAALFLGFDGIDYDGDPAAGARLDRFVRRVQLALARHGGTLLQITVGDKGSYLYAAFGAPIAHEDDQARAVAAALELQADPAGPGEARVGGIGLAYGQMRAGAYGGAAHRTYGVLGDRTNLAARLMQAAGEGGAILCDEQIARAAPGRCRAEALEPLQVKGKAEPISLFRLSAAAAGQGAARIDRLPAALQLTLKLASVIGQRFELELLRALHPQGDPAELAGQLAELARADLIGLGDPGAGAFREPGLRQAAYDLLLFAQRRRLHRQVAEWYEATHAADLSGHYELLAEHWLRAEEPDRASHYLELAGEQARRSGALDSAARLFRRSLSIDGELGP